MKTIEIAIKELDKVCICSIERDECPDQGDLVSGSLFEGMSCEIIIAKLALQVRRIAANQNASVMGVIQ